MADDWHRENAVDLPIERTLTDKAVSGYMGRNLDVGALGLFLEAIRGGLIAPGSFLLIENIDRMGRNEPLSAVDTVRQIVYAGVTIVTLQDKQQYTRAGLQDLGKLIQLIAFASRAFEESHTKSGRLHKTWDQKRVKARTGVPVTVRVPPWLEVTGSKLDGTRRDWTNAKIVGVPDRVIWVKKIFAWSIEGWGYRRISTELKQLKVPKWGRTPWSASTICKMIKGRAVLGEWQPYVYKGGAYGKRVADGEPVKDYFPRVIDDETWEQAQPGVTQHRSGSHAALLSGLVEDSDGRRMHYVRTGTPRTDYLVTGNTYLGAGESPTRWRASHLESAVCQVVQGIDWQRVMSDRSSEPELARLQAEISRLDAAEAGTLAKIENAAAAFLEGAFAAAVKKQAFELESKLIKLREDRAKVRTELDAVRRTLSTAGGGISVKGVPTDKRTRERLNAELRSVLKSIMVWPDGATGNRAARKTAYDYCFSKTSPRATEAIKAKRIMGAFRLRFTNEKSITVYVTYLPRDRTQKCEVAGFTNPEGWNLSDWLSACNHAAWRVAATTAVTVKT